MVMLACEQQKTPPARDGVFLEKVRALLFLDPQ
jgi:hypothetical protein